MNAVMRYLRRAKEIFHDSPDMSIKALFKVHKIRPLCIIHCGAGFAEEASTYHDLGIKSVFWIEAHPQIYSLMKRKIHLFPGQVPIQAALWNDTTLLNLNTASNWGSTSLLDDNLHSKVFPQIEFSKKIQVITSRLDSLKLQLSAHTAMIVDVQGAELKVLDGAKNIMHYIDFVYVEFSGIELYRGGATKEQLIDFLSEEFDLIDWQFSPLYQYGNLFFARKNLLKKSGYKRIWRKLLSILTRYDPNA